MDLNITIKPNFYEVETRLRMLLIVFDPKKDEAKLATNSIKETCRLITLGGGALIIGSELIKNAHYEFLTAAERMQMKDAPQKVQEFVATHMSTKVIGDEEKAPPIETFKSGMLNGLEGYWVMSVVQET